MCMSKNIKNVLLSEEKSVKTINIKKENIISAGRVINIDKLVNIDFYNIIKYRVFVKPIGIHFWTTDLDIQDFPKKSDLYALIFEKFAAKHIENI